VKRVSNCLQLCDEWTKEGDKLYKKAEEVFIYNAGKDEVMPSPKIHAEKVMRWAKGDKTLKFYEDGEHCTMNYLDEVFPEIIDWIKKVFER